MKLFWAASLKILVWYIFLDDFQVNKHNRTSALLKNLYNLISNGILLKTVFVADTSSDIFINSFY